MTLIPDVPPGTSDHDFGRDADGRQPRLDALVDLHTRIVDSLFGYETMVIKAEPSFRPVADAFRALHDRHAVAVAGILARLGHRPDTGGSLMGRINQTVVTVRSWFDDIDADVMRAIRDGEQHTLTAFSAVLAQPHGTAVIAEISAMRDELIGLLDRNSTAV